MLSFDNVPDKLTRIILAQNSEKDILLFKLALTQLPVPVQLTIARDEMQLGESLDEFIPDFVFLAVGMQSLDLGAIMNAIGESRNLRNTPMVLIVSPQDAILIPSQVIQQAFLVLNKSNNLFDLVEDLRTVVSLPPWTKT